MANNLYDYRSLEIQEKKLEDAPKLSDTELAFKKQLEIMEQWESGNIESNDSDIRTKRLSPSTIKTDIGLMTSLYNKMAGVTLDRAWINAAIKRLQADGVSDRSIVTYEWAIERFFKANLHNNNFKVPKHEFIVKEAPYHSLEEIHMMINGCKNIRDKAILATLYYAAPRVSELCNIKMKDLDLTNRLITINSTKQRRQRTIPLASEAIPIIQTWVNVRESILAKNNITNEYLFMNIQGNKFTTAGILNLVTNSADKVGLKSHPHTFRHSRVNHLLYVYNWDISLVAKFIGDSIAVIYSTYAHTSTKDLQNAMNISDQMKMKKLGGM